MAAIPSLTVFQKLRFPVRYPQAAVEVDVRAVLAVRFKREKVTKGRLLGYGLAELPETASPPTVASPKIGSPEDLKAAIRLAAERAGLKPGKASLLLPDTVARVWTFQLPELPRKPQALLEMLHWKIKRSLPFRVEDAAIVWQVLSRPAGAEQASILVGLIPRGIVSAYEALLASAGFKVGLVDLSSFNLYNFYRGVIANNGASTSDFAVLNATTTYFTMLLFRRGELAFFRCKSHTDAEGEGPEERVRMLRRELATSLSYYTEKLAGKGLAKTFVRISDPTLEGMQDLLESLDFGEIHAIDPAQVAVLPDGLDPTTALALVPAMGAALGRDA